MFLHSLQILPCNLGFLRKNIHIVKFIPSRNFIICPGFFFLNFKLLFPRFEICLFFALLHLKLVISFLTKRLYLGSSNFPTVYGFS